MHIGVWRCGVGEVRGDESTDLSTSKSSCSA